MPGWRPDSYELGFYEFKRAPEIHQLLHIVNDTIDEGDKLDLLNNWNLKEM